MELDFLKNKASVLKIKCTSWKLLSCNCYRSWYIYYVLVTGHVLAVVLRSVLGVFFLGKHSFSLQPADLQSDLCGRTTNIYDFWGKHVTKCQVDIPLDEYMLYIMGFDSFELTQLLSRPFNLLQCGLHISSIRNQDLYLSHVVTKVSLVEIDLHPPLL